MSESGTDLTQRAWRDLFNCRSVIAISVGIAAALGFAASFLVEKRYEAVITAVPIEHRESASELPGVLAGLGNLGFLAGLGIGSSDRNEAVAILRSRALVLSFIQSNSLIPVLFAHRWDAKHERWKGKAPTLGDAYRVFNDDLLTVTEDRRSGIVRLAVVWSDPLLAARWANGLVRVANEEMRDRAIGEADRGIQFLKQEIDKTQVLETREVIYRLMETRINLIMLANVRTEYAFRIIDPAIPSEPKDYVWPNRVLWTLAPAFMAFFGAVAVAMLRGARRRGVLANPGSTGR
jgi:uncharacterized protein involved in exopolysaccharide biosynthesis